METVSIPEPFPAISSHSPSEVVWCYSSHASQAANGIIGRSPFLVVMASPLRLVVPLSREEQQKLQSFKTMYCVILQTVGIIPG
jgi:hypothetical protein